ncbi:alpha/beta fold hydrolase [Paenibacillus glycinis]|uniref:Alpha/beta fold hydrolase n=1 Tax=Paenibacillus glycinis TaxID=2697035 RepID=A0ABW9XSS6_9BACL|nr:alpha/beta hydrolase [Paenibacillus glycinis]NBD25704.1 alpha/beta fold hydrolase [Paenibacillus glycinis]
MAGIAGSQAAGHETGMLFIHGAGLRGSIWEEVASGLGAPALLADFPFRDGGGQARLRLGLADYAAHLREQAEAWEVRRIVVVAHSLGGVPALQLAASLAAERRLAGFVAVGAAIPRDGGSFLSALPMPKRLLVGAVMRLFGTKPPASAIRSGLCHDLSPERAAAIVDGFVPEAIRVYADACGSAVPQVPSLYVKLTRDREFGSDVQERMIANLAPSRVESMAAGHLPMLSDPDGLRAILLHFLRACDQESCIEAGISL